MPDGDFIDLDFVEHRDRGSRVGGQGKPTLPSNEPPANAPLLALFHGLEGSSRSHYAAALMAAARDIGWRGVVVHFRGCSGEPNRLARAYHSGDAPEIDWIARRLREPNPCASLFAAGVSLGGNALLKWLGRAAQPRAAWWNGRRPCPPRST